MRKDIIEEVRKAVREGIKINASQVARRFDCDPRTVRKYTNCIQNEEVIKKPYKKRQSKLSGFEEIIKEKVDCDASAYTIFKFIEKQGYTGKYTIVRQYCKTYKTDRFNKATIRFETEPGFQAQVDWKEEMTLINKEGKPVTFNIFLMVLGYSRMKYWELTLDRNQDTLFKVLINGLKYFNGVPKEIIFDNMKAVVDQSRTQFQEAQYNSKFYAFSRDVGFDIWACRPYRPQTKGRVESLAKFTNRLRAYSKEFSTIEELINIVNTVRDEINKEESRATGEKPVDRVKKEHLCPLPNLDLLDTYLNNSHIIRKVSKESMIVYQNKKYSLATKYIGKEVELKVNDNTLEIYYNNILISKHELSKNQFNYHLSDAVEILKSDVMRFKEDSDIESFAKEHLNIYDNI